MCQKNQIKELDSTLVLFDKFPNYASSVKRVDSQKIA